MTDCSIEALIVTGNEKVVDFFSVLK